MPPRPPRRKASPFKTFLAQSLGAHLSHFKKTLHQWPQWLGWKPAPAKPLDSREWMAAAIDGYMTIFERHPPQPSTDTCEKMLEVALQQHQLKFAAKVLPWIDEWRRAYLIQEVFILDGHEGAGFLEVLLSELPANEQASILASAHRYDLLLPLLEAGCGVKGPLGIQTLVYYASQDHREILKRALRGKFEKAHYADALVAAAQLGKTDHIEALRPYAPVHAVFRQMLREKQWHEVDVLAPHIQDEQCFAGMTRMIDELDMPIDTMPKLRWRMAQITNAEARRVLEEGLAEAARSAHQADGTLEGKTGDVQELDVRASAPPRRKPRL